MKSIIAILLALATLSVFASPATKQRCTGIDRITYQEAVFTILSADWAIEAGYTTQEVNVIRLGNTRLSNHVYELTDRGFRLCNGNGTKRLRFLSNGLTRFTASCRGVELYDITAACKHVSL